MLQVGLEKKTNLLQCDFIYSYNFNFFGCHLCQLNHRYGLILYK